MQAQKMKQQDCVLNPAEQNRSIFLLGSAAYLLCSILTPTMGSSAESTLTMVAGLDYAEQSYEWGEKTEVITAPLAIEYETDRWISKVLITSLQSTESSNQNGSIQRSTDVGDMVFGVAYKTSVQLLGDNYVDLGIKANIPTENSESDDEKIEYMTQIDMFRSYRKWTPFATLGYRWRNNGLRQDGPYGTLGVQYQEDTTWSVGMMVNYNTQLYEGEASVVEAMPYIGYRFSPKWKVNVYVVKGLTENSVDTAGGFQLIYQPGRKSIP